MPRKTAHPRTIGPDWFLHDWLKSKQVTQAELMRLTGWGKARTNDIYHGKTDFYRDIVNDIAAALKIEPWELLMHPADANRIKRLLIAVDEEARLKVAETQSTFTPAPDPAAPLIKRGSA